MASENQTWWNEMFMVYAVRATIQSQHRFDRLDEKKNYTFSHSGY